jgi:hypothetical protein
LVTVSPTFTRTSKTSPDATPSPSEGSLTSVAMLVDSRIDLMPKQLVVDGSISAAASWQ